MVVINAGSLSHSVWSELTLFFLKLKIAYYIKLTSIFTVNVPLEASMAVLIRLFASCNFSIPPSLSSVDVVIT